MTRVAVVTGGTRGIGAAISRALKGAGYAVAATYHGNDEAANRFKAETGIAVYKWNVGDFNAGITRDTMLHKMTEQQWREVIATNLDSLFFMTRAVIEGMRARGFGRVVNISSINGQKGQLGQSNYAAAKAGMIGFSKSIALENANKGVTCNVIAPGYIRTDMVAAVPENVLQKIVAQIPVGRLGEAEEIARCVVFLASDEAGFVTGSTLTANGGQYLA